jgi:poly(3-hydroxybutyrate) depolymerase
MRRPRVVSAVALVVLGLVVAIVARRADAVPTFGAQVLGLTVDSRYVHARMPVTVVVSGGAIGRRPLVVFLHGRGGDETSELSSAFFRALRAAGRAAPVFAFPDGGDHSYWHNRHGASWPPTF